MTLNISNILRSNPFKNQLISETFYNIKVGVLGRGHHRVNAISVGKQDSRLFVLHQVTHWTCIQPDIVKPMTSTADFHVNPNIHFLHLICGYNLGLSGDDGHGQLLQLAQYAWRRRGDCPHKRCYITMAEAFTAGTWPGIHLRMCDLRVPTRPQVPQRLPGKSSIYLNACSHLRAICIPGLH